jgi:hypothetical protein
MPKPINLVLSEADQLMRVWTANPTFVMGETTKAVAQALVDDLRQKQTLVHETETLLIRLKDEAGDKSIEVNELVTRGRSGIRATFGPDSPQYNQVGCTRLSDRKPRKSKHAAAPVPTA